jgi:hypothetical protein
MMDRRGAPRWIGPSLVTIVVVVELLALCVRDTTTVRAWSEGASLVRLRHHRLLFGNWRRHGQQYSNTSVRPDDDDDRPTGTAEDEKVVRIYSRPSLYDLAFGYRDYKVETKNLLRLHEDAAHHPATSVLEVAAGPARHCLELADDAIITKTYAIDNSQEMKEYSASLRRTDQRTMEDVADDHHEYLVQDMRHISLPTKVDTAWLLLGSFQHMVTLSDAVQCFKSVSHALNANGTFILELPHPKEIFEMVDCTTNTWTVPLDVSDQSSSTDASRAGQLEVIWGDADDAFDPISHVRHATIGFHLTTGDGQVERWIDTVPMKSYTVPELYLLAELTGFRMVRLLGALDNPDELVPIDDEDLAYRLVCVLQKL